MINSASCRPGYITKSQPNPWRRAMEICKTGEDHLRSLRDGRAVYIDGGRVDEVTTHTAFRNACAAADALYDYQAHQENRERDTNACASAVTGATVRID